MTHHLVMWAGESSRVVRSSGICHWTTSWSLSIFVPCAGRVAWQQALGSCLRGRTEEHPLREVVDEVVEAQRLLRQPRARGACRRRSLLGHQPPGHRAVHAARRRHPAGRGPGRVGDRGAVGSAPRERSRAQAVGLPQDRLGGGVLGGRPAHLHPQGPPGRHDVLGGVADLGAARGLEDRRGDERLQHRARSRCRAGGRPWPAASTRDCGGSSRTNFTASRRATRLRRLRVRREVVGVAARQLAPVLVAVRVAEAHHGHRTGRVVLGGVRRREGLPDVDPPAGEDPGRVLDVRLGEVALTDRVQLEQLATEVLVGARRGRRGVVQVDAHRRVGRRGEQQVAEPPERPRADRVAVRHAVGEDAVRGDGHVEVVLPELRHHLEHLAARPHPPHQRPAHVVLHHHPARLDLALRALPQVERGAAQRRPPASTSGRGRRRPCRARAARRTRRRTRRRRAAYVADQVLGQAVGEAGDEVSLGTGEDVGRRLLPLLVPGLPPASLARGIEAGRLSPR